MKTICYNPLNSKTTSKRINKNTIWTVTTCDDDIVFESVDGVRNLSLVEFDKHLTYDYVGTTHSYQGRSEDDDMTLFEIDNKYVTKHWLYVAVSRSRHPTQMSVFTGTLPETIQKHDISSHKCADFKKGFEWEEIEYVNNDWAINQQFNIQKNSCPICKSVITTASIDRILNSHPHIKGNCQIVCICCNKSKK
jgi:hypothetical protein